MHLSTPGKQMTADTGENVENEQEFFTSQLKLFMDYENH